MATPVYHAAWRNRDGYRNSGGYRERGRYGSRSRTWGNVTGRRSMLGGDTPSYFGSGQPLADGSLFDDGTPAYRMPPAAATISMTATAPSETASNTTTDLPAPDFGQVAIVVPRS